MLIIVTDQGNFWNHNNPLLEKYASCVIVVCLNGKPVTKKYKCIVSPYKPIKKHMFGFAQKETFWQKYKAFASIKKEFEWDYFWGNDILFLTDNNPESLIPYLVLRNKVFNSYLHLWAMPPFKFESEKGEKLYEYFLYEPTNLNSLCCLNDDVLNSIYSKCKNFSSFYEQLKTLAKETLPTVVYEISEELNNNSKYYFDFNIKRYIKVNDFRQNSLEKKPLNDDTISQFCPTFSNDVFGNCFVYKTKQNADDLEPVINGKEICDQLKNMRIVLAKANNIEYSSQKCTSKGACAGTCPECDKELAELQKKLLKIPKEKRVYPYFKIEQNSGVPKTFDINDLITEKED